MSTFDSIVKKAAQNLIANNAVTAAIICEDADGVHRKVNLPIDGPSPRPTTFTPAPKNLSIGDIIKQGFTPVVAAERHLIDLLTQVGKTYRNFAWWSKDGTVGKRATLHSGHTAAPMRSVIMEAWATGTFKLDYDAAFNYADLPVETVKNYAKPKTFETKKGTKTFTPNPEKVRPIAGARLYYASRIAIGLYDELLAAGEAEDHAIIRDLASACATLGQLYWSYWRMAREDRDGTDPDRMFTFMLTEREGGYVEREYDGQIDTVRAMEADVPAA
jgi:hypothetical protein